MHQADVLVMACALTAALAAGPARGDGREVVLSFTDISAEAGVGLPGELTESVAWGDYDNDGDEDLYLTNNGSNRLFRNDGGGDFTDVTDVAGVGDDRFSVGVAFGDLDNDGDLDLYVVHFSDGLDALYRNNGPVGPGGAYTFTDVADEAGLDQEQSSRGMAFLDYNRDGRLDIYVVAIGENILYENLGDLQFVDVAPELGVNANDTGVGVVCSDLDNNGWVDIFTGNRSSNLNRLYLNDGGLFTDATEDAGIDATGLGMGVLAFDHDNDLDLDLYWTTWPGGGMEPTPNAFYDNNGDATFTNITDDTGTADPLGWGISGNAGDIDNDRFQDFFVTNGFDDGTTPNVLFHNQQDETYVDVTSTLSGGADVDGRGAAFDDFDQDGDLDLVLTTDAENETRLWRNDSAHDHHWLTLTLVGRSSNWSAIGARIEVTAGGMTTVQEVSGGAGRGSFNSLPVEFGLGEADAVESITIRWPNGYVQTVTDVTADQRVKIVELDIAGGPAVDTEDLLFLLAEWGQTSSAADVNDDGIVDAADLLIILGNWSP
ncbi:MAG: CRTAC1 family protein [Planctomycetota bacterium]|nr:CRTAC1 family protein [Planctomycetota bacterium]